MRHKPQLSVLVLPGGTDSSYRPFRPWQGSALRMYPFTWSIAARFGRNVAVRQVRYRVYGWNGGQASPVPYARATLDAITRKHPGVPVVLIGHSMGGRVAARLAADPRIVGVLALAPWWPDADLHSVHNGVRVLALHGDADTITFACDTEKEIADLHRRGIDATFVSIPYGKHPMLDHVRLWQSAAIDFVSDELQRQQAR
ncbi:MAG: alpha/beta fold hydrolase [Gordonia sp. (in: high G+C Gram-positive bacteria)]